MGRNVDINELLSVTVACPSCGKDLDLSEIDMDCDTKSHHPNSLEINYQCFNCDKEDIGIVFNITHEVKKC